MPPNLPFLSAAPNAILKPGGPLKWTKAVSKRRKAFAAAQISDKDREAYISASQHVSSVIHKAKAEAWQATCSSPSPKSNPKSVYSLLRSVAGCSSSSPDFSGCSSPRESASVFADYLISHFSVSQPKALRVAEPEATFPSSAEPRVLRNLIRFFAPPLNFLGLAQTSPRPLPPAQTKLPIPC